MSSKLYEENSVQDIANAIREKGVSGTFTIGEMGNAVRQIETGGGGEQPTLFVPTIAIKSDYLIIAPNENNGEFNTGSTYYIYANGDLVHTTTETSILLYDIITKAGDYNIYVIQGHDKFQNSAMSNELEWVWKGGLRFTNTSSTEATTLQIVISGTLTNSLSTYYMRNSDENWVEWFSGTSGSSTEITIPAGEYIEIWNESETWAEYTSSNLLQSNNNDILAQLETMTFPNEQYESESAFLTANGINYPYFKTAITGTLDVSGAINSLINGTAVTGKVDCFYQTFTGMTRIVNASNLTLPTTDLTGANACYYQMFYGCTNLKNAPSLPATTLESSCYSGMFWHCTSLTTAPELPITTLAKNCYRQLFSGCTSLTTAPELPATTLENSCYYQMFSNSGLTTAPELPATTLSDSCYYGMFYGCKSLVNVPNIKAVYLAKNCCASMFKGCTALVNAPSISATISTAQQCYDSMFYGCTSLTKPMVIGANSLSNKNWYQMYYGCSSLKVGTTITSSSQIVCSVPKTTGTNGVTEMFKGCDIDSETSWAETGTPTSGTVYYYTN